MSASNVTDLVSRASAGDNAAFEELYRQHAGRVYALCLRLSGDTGRASELTQDVFVRCWERLESFRGESAFSSWLHRLAVNVALSTHRRDSRRWRRVQAVAILPDAPGTVRSDSSDIDLEKAITTLPTGARTVFVLHDVEGYKHEEIANLMGIAVGTSKAHLFRARRLLRKSLEPQ
ncbi:MAG: RNA polymerase sigma factor [Anaerolineae bacterium]|nr:RNA polymerase sigma factor [Gemmatimonadaceae bacterium]